MIYIIQAEGTPRVKIGWAKNPEQRRRELQTGSPYPLKLLHTIETDEKELEAELHRQYQTCRVQGEWFELPEIALEAIQEATEGDITKVRAALFLMTKDLRHRSTNKEAIRIWETARRKLNQFGLKSPNDQLIASLIQENETASP